MTAFLSRFTITATAAAVFVAVTGAAVSAADFPDGPISLVVGFKPGGESDSGARGIAPFWEKELGVPVVIDSRPGAAMQVALEYSWAKPHDGYTILWHNQQYLSALEVADPELTYATDQWVWLDVLENDPAVITVRSDAKWDTLDELVTAMKENPNTITVGLLTGSVQLVGCKSLFEDVLGVSFREVPQGSGAPMRTSLVGGHLDVICTNAVGTYSLGDEVKTLGVFQNGGSKLLPEAQSVNDYLAEKGIDRKIPDLGSLRGAAVPADLVEKYPERYEILKTSYRNVVQSQAYQDWLEQAGRASISGQHTQEEAAAMIAEYNAFFLENKDVLLGN